MLWKTTKMNCMFAETYSVDTLNQGETFHLTNIGHSLTYTLFLCLADMSVFTKSSGVLQ